MVLLVAGGTESLRQKWISDFLEKHTVHTVDRYHLKGDTSIGIGEARALKLWLTVKPLVGKTKAAVIDKGELLTTEAQNALLKLLEEPPENTIVLLSSPREDILLPTILSRVSLISLGQSKMEEEKLPTPLPPVTLEDLGKASIAQKLEYADLLASDRDIAKLWVLKTLFDLDKRLTTGADPLTVKRTRSVQKLEQDLSTNVNLRLALEHFFLAW